ncbi:uncharacterized protein LOC112568721 [Pomacea canaliculata]|uniref:uncharacterized protein LOC112568721 n=1 Tax=Pomacea canaliculata TaxID=400727 RepID=UPI000D73E799|nr:uncharacterized protein LOC112568721 [Pomacea canaliculata]
MDNSCTTRQKPEQTRDEVETGPKDPKTDVNNTAQRIYFRRDGHSDSLKDPKPDDNNTVQRAAGQTILPRPSRWGDGDSDSDSVCITLFIDDITRWPLISKSAGVLSLFIFL